VEIGDGGGLVGGLKFAVFGSLLVHPFEEGWFVGGGGGEEVVVSGGVVLFVEGEVFNEAIVLFVPMG